MLIDFPFLISSRRGEIFTQSFKRTVAQMKFVKHSLHGPRLFDKERELGRSPQGAYELELGTLSGNELILDVDVQTLVIIQRSL